MLRESVYTELKRGLLLGEHPGYVRLGEERLAELFGVSRTPVREALVRLYAEGLVARHPDGGYCPVPPDVEGMRQLYEVRIALEASAMRRPARLDGMHDLGMLEALRDEWRGFGSDGASSDPEFVLLDESFHCALAATAGNRALVEMLQVVNERIRIVRMQDFLVPGRIGATVEQHLQIVDALIAGDIDAAMTSFEAHVGESFDHVADQVARAVARMARFQVDQW
jgi:DNA-binding GntR family transcriptional regulator